MKIEIEKPPLGIMPRNIWLEKRLIDINEAIERYKIAKANIPNKWITEAQELEKEIQELKTQEQFARKISRESIFSFGDSYFFVSELLKNMSFEEMEKVYEVGGIYALKCLAEYFERNGVK